MKRSPARVVELCVYILLIIGAVIWMLSGGRLYNPDLPDPPAPPELSQTAEPSETPPPIMVPKGDVLPGR
jgi:hypothetical protein